MGVPESQPTRDARYQRSVRAIGWQVALVCAALVIGGGVLAFVWMLWQTRPAEQHGPGEPGSIRVYLEPADLILAGVVAGLGAVLLAGAAAWLIARRAVRPIDDALQVQRRFVADASHELRTPIAVLSARLQQFGSLPEGDPRRSPILNDLRDDARILSEIVDDMLAVATGAPPANGSASVASVLSGVVEDMTLIAGLKDVALVAPRATGTVLIPAAEFRRCLVALIDNAIDHSPASGIVSVSATRTGSRLRVRVEDMGNGITGIAPERLFDRFAHGAASPDSRGESRTRMGIGLALVKEIAIGHGGEVRVVRTGPEGTVFELELPCRDEQGQE